MSRYVVNPGVVFREEEDGGIVLDPETGSVKYLNGTGAFIFKLCDGTHTLEDIVEKVLQEFDVQREEEVAGHVRAFLGELVDGGLVGLEGDRD